MLRGVDHLLFHLINGVWTSRFLDALMPAITDLHKVKPVVFVLVPAGLAFWLCRGRRFAAVAILGLALTVGLSDSLAHRLLKPLFHRARPDPTRMEVILRTGRLYGYSFPSNHATNCFAGAMFLASFYPGLRLPLFAAASIVAYSRVYVGVHYPFDVLAGALFGLAVGWCVAAAFRRLYPPK